MADSTNFSPHRLKIMDFENVIYQTPYELQTNKIHKKFLNLNKEDRINEIDTDISGKDDTLFKANMLNRKMYNARNFNNRITHGIDYTTESNNNHTIDEKSFYKDVIKLSQLAGKIFRDRCSGSRKSGLVAMMKCARRSNIDGSFLKIMTKLLNKYANSVYKFTEEMTEVLLVKILGENTDLRNNIYDVNKLLGYLRQALHAHKVHENRDVIALSSKQCLTVSLPGCFCKSGFVENLGQCVKPSDCIGDSPLYDEYLTRLVVT